MTVEKGEISKEKTNLKNKRNTIYVLTASCTFILVTAALILVIIATRKSEGDNSSLWRYSNQDKWPGVCQTGKRQSPIDLSLHAAEKIKMPNITLSNFKECDCLEVENNGHTVSVYLADGCQCVVPSLIGGKLKNEYAFNNLHFHWPAEHTIENIRYDFEAHFVFYAIQYGNFETALKYSDGLSVVGVLFGQNKTDNNNSFKSIATAVKSLPKRSGVRLPVRGLINFEDLLPPDYDMFFTYEGSLTTPTCTENVQWIVFKSIASISDSDIESISGIYDEDYKLLKTNSRELHPLNGRNIYFQAESE